MTSDNKRIEQNTQRCKDFIVDATYNKLNCSCTPKDNKGGGEKKPHRDLKYIVCNWCWERGLRFATEVKFNNRSRADIVIFSLGMGIEVLSSEDLKSFNGKNYPIPTLPFQTKVFDEKRVWDLLDDLLSTYGEGVTYYQREGVDKK